MRISPLLMLRSVLRSEVVQTSASLLTVTQAVPEGSPVPPPDPPPPHAITVRTASKPNQRPSLLLVFIITLHPISGPRQHKGRPIKTASSVLPLLLPRACSGRRHQRLMLFP